MSKFVSRRALVAGAVTALMATSVAMATGPAHAQTWPAKPVHFILGQQPGGITDIIARLIADELSKSLGQPVIVENRPGAGNTLAHGVIASAAPDGYTIGMIAPSPAAAAPLLQKLTYTVDDFEGIAKVADLPMMFLAQPSLNVNTLGELIALVQSNPDKYNFGSDGIGSATHLGFELFMVRAGKLDVQHIPLKGTAEILAAYGSGDIQMSVNGVQQAIAQVKEGSIKALAIAGKAPVPALPDVPVLSATDAPAGVKELDLSSWIAVAGPAGIPTEIRDRLNTEIVAILSRPEIRERIEGPGGLFVSTGTADELNAQLDTSAEQWKEAIESAGIAAAN